MELIGNMSNAHSRELDEEEAPQLQGSLQRQLEQIAATHPLGLIPVHGRLFAQWLHYVFPRECPFPHAAGSAAAHTAPAEFEKSALAAKEEMVKHAHGLENSTADWEKLGAAPEDAHWMSQWSDEEELVAAGGAAPRVLWEAGGLVESLVVLAVSAATWVALRACWARGGEAKLLPTHLGGGKVHLL